MIVNGDSGNVNTDSGKDRESVHVQPEQVFTMNRNRCSRSTGMSVHDQPDYALEQQVDGQTQWLAQGQRPPAFPATHAVIRPQPAITAAGAFIETLFKVMLEHVVTVVLALFIRAVGKRQAERQEVAGEGAHRLVVPEVEGLTAPLTTNLAFALFLVLLVLQAVIRIVGDRVFLCGGLARVVQAEVPAQAIAAHGPAEGTVEFGEIDGCCQGESNRVCVGTSILQENLKMEEETVILLI